MNSIMGTVSDHGKEMTYLVLRKVADNWKMVVLKQFKIQLVIEEVVTLCDIVGVGTNGI